VVAVTLAVVGSACATDPASVFASRSEARSFDCTRTTQAEAARLAPGLVPEPSVRSGVFAKTDGMVCQRQYLTEGERPNRDEAILSTLTASVGELVRLAASVEPSLRSGHAQGPTQWYVDAFYPEPRVAAKLALSARVLLAEEGHVVFDRVPLLAALDVAVISRMPVQQSFPIACARYFVEKTLHEPQVFLALMIVDPREAQVHAGLCARGQWRWLR
jgi:hypothetical protein